MPPLKFSCRLWLHYPISRWDRPSSAVKSIQRATQSDLDFEKPDFFIDENHEIMDETMDESWIPQRIMRRNLTGMMSFHLGRLGKGQHTPAEKKIEGWSMRLPRNRPGFFHLEKLQCPASSSVDAWKQCGKAAHLPFHPSHEVCPETSRFSTFKLHDFFWFWMRFGSIWIHLEQA